eukprot:921710_1
MARSLYIVFQVHLIASTFSQTCDTPYQCVGKTIKKAQTGEIHINGYKAAIGATTSLSNNANTSSIIMCAGSFSCQGISPFTTSANVNCKSTRSCSNTSLQITNNGLAQCYGFQSCVFSTLTSVDASEIVCCGEQSCAYSRIFLANVLDGAGTHSLYLATIYSQGSSANIALQLTGKLAGYGATLICNAGHTCSITCLGHDSCYMFYADCVDNCVIVADGTIAPITNISELHIDAIDHNNADSMCNTHPNAITYDNNLQLLSSQITIQAGEEGPVCCRAREACSKSSITYASANTESVVCSGAWACKNALIDVNNGSVFCESADSCKFAQIDRSSCVYCKAFIACHTATITASRFIKCSGKESCINSIIHSGGTDLDLYLTGDNAGATATIYCNQNDWCNVRCIGYGSCTGTTLVCDGICNVYCDSISQCPQGWTSSPVLPTPITTEPTLHPTVLPTPITTEPTLHPTVLPTPITTEPTLHPTVYPSVHPTNYPTVHPSSVPSVTPSDSPTKHPTTASPTQPGAILCGETSVGPYSNAQLIFETQIPFDGDLTFDARESSFEVTGIEMFTQLGSLLATDSDHDGVITLGVPSGDYRFIMMGNAQSNDTYHVNVACVSDQPTQVPTKIPTPIPTMRPSYSPVDHPITPHPTKTPIVRPTQFPTTRPTFAPVDHPITSHPSPSPSVDPTIDPTTAPTVDPISVSTKTTADVTVGTEKVTESAVDHLVMILVGAISFLALIICILVVVVCYYRKHGQKHLKRKPQDPAIQMQNLQRVASLSLQTARESLQQTAGSVQQTILQQTVPQLGEVDGDDREEGEKAPQYIVSSANMAITNGNTTAIPENNDITVGNVVLAYGNMAAIGPTMITTDGTMAVTSGNV